MKNWSTKRDAERGVALITVLLLLSLLMALVMGISLTSISEAGVTNTYSNHTKAFQAAEAGLNHSLSLVRNYTNGLAGSPDLTNLLAKRGTVSTNYLVGNNPFTDPSYFSPGALMLTNVLDGAGNVLLNHSGNPVGCQFVDASGTAISGAYYSVHVIDD